jgi:putative NADH-flavin reductase
MKIAVIGASGRTGRELLDKACEAGHDVVSVVRNPSRMHAGIKPSVRVAEATSAPDLVAALQDVDAVAFCIGPVPGESRTIQDDAVAATLEAMRSTGTDRIVAISASGGVVDGDDPVTRFIAKPIIQLILRHTFADMARMEARIKRSPTNWTILRPPRLTDQAPKGRYRSRRDGNVRWGFQITRADLATAVLDALADPTSRSQTVSVAN